MTASPPLERFAALAAEFLAAAERGDVPAMDRIMGRRRELLPHLAESGGTSGDDPGRRDLLARILDLDRRAGIALATQRDEAGRELARLDSTRRGLGGYGGGARRAARRIDARG